MAADRHAYLVPTTAKVLTGGIEVHARDGVAITGVEVIEVAALEDSEHVLVDLQPEFWTVLS